MLAECAIALQSSSGFLPCLTADTAESAVSRVCATSWKCCAREAGCGEEEEQSAIEKCFTPSSDEAVLLTSFVCASAATFTASKISVESLSASSADPAQSIGLAAGLMAPVLLATELCRLPGELPSAVAAAFAAASFSPNDRYEGRGVEAETVL